MSQEEFSIVILGNSNVGKTSLLERYIDDTFCKSWFRERTLGASYRKTKTETEGKKFNVGIWDTAGIEKYHPMTRRYLHEVSAAIVCYDMTEPYTFQIATNWVSELKVFQNSCKIYLCGTKKDLCDRNITPYPARNIVEKYANESSAKLFVTSSKTGENIAEMFHEVLQEASIRHLRYLTLQRRKQKKKSLFGSLMSWWMSCWM